VASLPRPGQGIARTVRQGWVAAIVTAVIATSATAAERDADNVSLACHACRGLLAQMADPKDGPVFLRSYEPANGASALHPALENTAFTYDNALALMGLVACDRTDEAKRVADALVIALQSDRFYHDGRLRNAYRSGATAPAGEAIELPGYWDAARNLWVEDGYQVGSATGSTAWGALALLTAYEATGTGAYLDSARAIMRWVDASTADPSGSGYYGGFFGHEPTPEGVTWKSTEHNVDVAAANLWLDRIEPRELWETAAGRAQALIAKMWDATSGRYYVGTVPGSDRPNAETSGLDALLWPLIAIPGQDGKAGKLMSWTERNHGVPGGFDFNDDRDGIWLEGTAQAALIYRLVGPQEKAAPLFATMREQMSPGGLVYATVKEEITTGLKIGPGSDSGDFKYYRLPHIAATAWAILAATRWNPFNGGMEAERLDWNKQCHPKS
jgi:hypothetical protein